MASKTIVHIEQDRFHINGEVTCAGCEVNGRSIEGLLLNSRMVQGIFDDLNPQTRARWDYPDGPWDPQRNTREFIQAMPTWWEHGLDAFTINLQGGSPMGYSREQPWHNSSFDEKGGLRPAYLERLGRILDRADELGMVVILGYFYFGQDHRLEDEHAVRRAAENATEWLLDRGDRHVLIEIGNEVDCPRYTHELIRPQRGHELMRQVAEHSAGRVDTAAGRLLVGNSFCGGNLLTDNIIEASDFLLLHGNGVEEPDRIRDMVDQTRRSAPYRGQPILFNEDDHFDFDKPDNNMLAALSHGAGWGYFDWRFPGEGFDEGYQSVPVNWGISSQRKRGFFSLLKRINPRD